MATKNKKAISRLRRKRVIRKRISGSQERPRLSVYRSSEHMYAQVIDDANGRTIASASTLSPELKDELAGKKKSERAALVGQLVAAKCRDKGIEAVIFDRNGFVYHGRIKAVADGARKGGLQF